jgi:hypothetical protein
MQFDVSFFLKNFSNLQKRTCHAYSLWRIHHFLFHTNTSIIVAPLEWLISCSEYTL